MRIEKIAVSPVRDSINPELLFEIEFHINRKFEVPLQILGTLYSKDNKKIANFHQDLSDTNTTLELAARNSSNEGEQKLSIKLFAPLSEKALNFIQDIRNKTPTGDIDLTLNLYIQIMHSKTTISYMHIQDSNKFPSQFKTIFEGRNLITYRFQRDYIAPASNMWILSGDGRPTFLEFKNYYIKKIVKIFSSQWINDYCPVFQIGKFIVYELPILEELEDSQLNERLVNSIDKIKEMKTNLMRGEWEDVIADSREIWELIKNTDEITDILIESGYTEEASKDLNDVFRGFFNLSSKFIHRLNRSKTDIIPKIPVSKEDAYLIYTLSLNIINLLANKLKRLKP